MPQTVIPNNFYLDVPIGAIALTSSQQDVDVETYSAIPGVSSCSYVNLRDDRLSLSRIDFPPVGEAIAFAPLQVIQISVFCRPNYNSPQFPSNPRFAKL